MSNEIHFVRCKTQVMSAKTQDEILVILSSMSEDRQDVVLTQALDLWEMDGCPLSAGQDSGTVVCDNNVSSHSNKHALESRLSMEINVG